MFKVLDHNPSVTDGVTLGQDEFCKFKVWIAAEQKIDWLYNLTNALQANIAIMRTFVKLRELMNDHRELAN